MLPIDIFFILLIIIVPVFIIAGIIHFARAADKTLKNSASTLGAKYGVLGRYCLIRNGVKFWYAYSPGAKNTPPSLTVAMSCPAHGEFTVRRENNFDGMAKRIGFSSELQTGDADFDNNFYILSDTLNFAKLYFQSAAKRDVIKSIYSSGFGQVKYNGKVLTAVYNNFYKESLSPEFLTSIFDHLKKLSENLPDYFGDELILGMPGRKLAVITLYMIPSLMFLSAVIGWFWSSLYPVLDSFDIFFRSLTLSIPAIVLYCIAAAILVRGRASSHRDFLGISAAAIVAFLLFFNNAFILINGAKDTSRPIEHNVRVMNKYFTTHKNSSTYYAVLQSWRPGRSAETFKVYREVYDGIRYNATEAIVYTRKGALGYEWLVSLGFRNIEANKYVPRKTRFAF